MRRQVQMDCCMPSTCLQVKRCDEMARRLHFFKNEVEKAGLTKPVEPLDTKDLAFDEVEVRHSSRMLICPHAHALHVNFFRPHRGTWRSRKRSCWS